jgi:hypothetical protein
MKHSRKTKEGGRQPNQNSRKRLKVGSAVGAVVLFGGLGAFGDHYIDSRDWHSDANKANQNESILIDNQRTDKKLACISKVVLMAGAKLYSNPQSISHSILFGDKKSNQVYTVPKGEEVISYGSWNIPSGEYEGWAPVNIVSATEASKPTFYKATDSTDFSNSLKIASNTSWTHLYSDIGNSIATESNTGANCYINRDGQTIQDGTDKVMNYAIVVPVDSPGVIDRMSSSN